MSLFLGVSLFLAAFRDTAREFNVPVAIERSRSGNGAHGWIFFDTPIPAVAARKMGTYLLTETMSRRPEVGLDSYDRLFPNQDTMPKGGFGNLIALPLQKQARENGNSEFLNDNLIPYADQWEYLAGLQRMSRREVEKLATFADESGSPTGLRMPLTDEFEDRPWDAPPSRKSKIQIVGPFPEAITLTRGNQLYVPHENLSPSLRNAIIRTAAFQNPEFYQKQAMRMNTWDTPRVIACAENLPQYIALPRGCFDDVAALLKKLKIKVKVIDERFSGEQIDVKFNGELYSDQREAADAILAHDTGILAATTAFGKTVVAIDVIAERKVNTLILVHRKQLLEQWLERLCEFLNILLLL